MPNSNSMPVLVGALVAVGLIVAIMMFASPTPTTAVTPTAAGTTATAGPTGTPPAAGATRSATPGATAAPSPAPSGTQSPEQALAGARAALDVAWGAGDWPRAIQLLEQIRSLAPTDTTARDKLYTAHYNYGKQLESRGDKNGAATEYQAALAVVPGGPEALAALRALTPTPAPAPTRAGAAASTSVPPTPGPLRGVVTVEWQGNMDYENRTGDMRWCQMKNIYHNLSAQNLDWPDYQPAIAVARPDGSIRILYRANYYSVDQGWQNGIKGTPPTIPAGKDSFPWTWYSSTGAPGEYCRFVTVTVQGVTYTAEYDARGQLINPNAVMPR
ncbi:MAG: hypothetical protein HZB53_06745 [Chloroflexi bacterium]|nr:hypothetical protein [Chloroflexota bacterium]